MTSRFKGWVLFGLLLGTTAYALAESMTLTTYYPSPRGIYKELRTQQLKITDGREAAGKVLTSDDTGQASWKPLGGEFVGTTAQTYPGSLGGYEGAAAKCAAQFPGSRMCAASDFVSVRPSGKGWYSTFLISGGTTSDCVGWTTSLAVAGGSYWSETAPAYLSCDNAAPILCCR